MTLLYRAQRQPFPKFERRTDTLHKIRLESAELQAKVAERESRSEKVSLAGIAEYAPKSSVFDDIE